MANPVVVKCPKNVWTLVATNVQSGNIWITKSGVEYFHSHRVHGEDGPEGVSEKAPMGKPGLPIRSAVGRDIYIYCANKDGVVRVDV